jgi:hypothetical protein
VGGDISLGRHVLTGSWADTASYLICIKGFYTGIQPPELEAVHTPPSEAEVKNTWSFTYPLPYISLA